MATQDQQAIVPVLRTVRSCDRCKLKKIKCNNAVPCDQCLSHNTQCTYNLPNRRKRYTLNAIPTKETADPSLIKIKNLEAQLNNYKLQIQTLERTLVQYLSPVPSRDVVINALPLSHANELVHSYEEAGRWISSYFDTNYEQLKIQNGSKESTWQLLSAFSKSYGLQYIKQCNTEGLTDMLSWINVFLLGELVQDKSPINAEAMIETGLNILMTLFFERGIQFNNVLAPKIISDLVVLSTYLKMSDKLAAYTTTMGFLTQLIQLHDTKLDPSLVFSTYGALLVNARDLESRERWQSKFLSQPTQPHFIDYVKFQIFSVLSALLFEQFLNEKSYWSLIDVISKLEKEVSKSLGNSYWGHILRIWCCAIEAELAIRVGEADRYDHLKQQIIVYFKDLPSQTYRNRAAKVFRAVNMICKSRGFFFIGTSFMTVMPQPVPITATEFNSSPNSDGLSPNSNNINSQIESPNGSDRSNIEEVSANNTSGPDVSEEEFLNLFSGNNNEYLYNNNQYEGVLM